MKHRKRLGQRVVTGVVAERTFDRRLAPSRRGGFSPVCQMLHGTPEDQIAAYVTGNDVNMLVMGAYGHSRIRYLIIGSTTAEMVRTCRVPVLLFR